MSSDHELQTNASVSAAANHLPPIDIAADQDQTFSVREALPWFAVSLLYAGLALSSLSSFGTVWFQWVVGTRAALAFGALALGVWRLAGFALPASALTIFFFLALGVQSTHALLEGPGRDAFLQLNGVLFVLTAAVFQVSRREWLMLFLPLCATLLYVPAFFKADIAQALMLTTGALVLGQGVAWIKSQRERAEDLSRQLSALVQTQKTMVIGLRRSSFVTQSALADSESEGSDMTKRPNRSDLQLVRDLQSPLTALTMLTHADDEISPASKKLMEDAITRIRIIAEKLAVTTVQNELESARNASAAVTAARLASAETSVEVVKAEKTGNDLLSQGEAETFDLHSIVQMIESVMERKRAEYGQRQRVEISWSRSVDPKLPLELQINSEDLINIISSLIDQGVESLGGFEGVVRLGLNPGLGQVQFTIEDNGRGISDELLSRVQSRESRRDYGQGNGGNGQGNGQRNGPENGQIQNQMSDRENGRDKALAHRFHDRLNFKQIRALITFWGGTAERQSRLGVGSRVAFTLPRVDAYATPFAGLRNAEEHTLQTRNS